MATDSDEVDWEAIGRERLERTATRTADEIETAIRVLGGEIGRGTADASDVAEARKAIENAIYVVEDTLVPGVPDTEAGDGDTRYIRHDGAAADYLRLTMDQVNEANLGATVELGTEEIRAICSGSGVQVETPAGIEIELLPGRAGRDQHGTMTRDATETTAEVLSLTTGIPKSDIPIEATGDALWDGDAGSNVPMVTLQVGGRDAGLSVTLTADAAVALREDLQDAIEDAHADVERFSDDRGGDDE